MIRRFSETTWGLYLPSTMRQVFWKLATHSLLQQLSENYHITSDLHHMIICTLKRKNSRWSVFNATLFLQITALLIWISRPHTKLEEWGCDVKPEISTEIRDLTAQAFKNSSQISESSELKAETGWIFCKLILALLNYWTLTWLLLWNLMSLYRYKVLTVFMHL